MATIAQIKANQSNSRLSTGPRTPEGKAIVSLNRTTHGLTGAHIILPGEDPAAFDALLDAYRAEHQPQTPTAQFLVQTLAHSQWKLDRIARLEAKILAQDPDAVSDVLLRLTRYESATRRAWNAALKQLHDLRKLAARDHQAALATAAEEDEKQAEAELSAMLEANAPKPFTKPFDPTRQDRRAYLKELFGHYGFEGLIHAVDGHPLAPTKA